MKLRYSVQSIQNIELFRFGYCGSEEEFTMQ